MVADPAGKHAFTFSSPDPAVKSRGWFECRLDGHLPSGGDWSTCSSPWSEPVSRGSHRFEVRAVDPSGNADVTPDSWEWFQQIPPETTIAEGPVEGFAVASAHARFRLGPADASFGCRLDGGGWFPCGSTPEFGGLADGRHTFEARAGNAFGELDQSPARRSWRGDTTSPDTAITSGPGDGELTTSRGALFSFVSEPGARLECRLHAACSVKAG